MRYDTFSSHVPLLRNEMNFRTSTKQQVKLRFEVYFFPFDISRAEKCYTAQCYVVTNTATS